MDEETRAEVAEEATPETETEQTEQRADDYEGLARRLDEVLSKLDRVYDKLETVEGMYSTFVDAGAIVTGASDQIAAATAEAVAEAIEYVTLEDLDYTL